MPLYSYICDCGWTGTQYSSMGKARSTVQCRKCRKRARRDYRADLPRTHVDTDFCQDDYAQNVGDRRLEKKEVRNGSLSRFMNKIPGLPKYRGPDGKMYACFKNRKHRRETLKRLGMTEAE